MEIVSLLVVIAMLLALCFVVAFVWASKKGQFDDLDTPAYRVLIDDQPVQPNQGEKQ
ncbi:MAG: cbb3-type cytochrome oxidase assembly protein CcoS [Bdellovibrionota bacterium]